MFLLLCHDTGRAFNLKKACANSGGRDEFRRFGSCAEGIIAARKQLEICQKRDELTTPRQMVAKWVPASDGNDRKHYVETPRFAGVALDARIDMSAPGQAARRIKGVALAESPVGRRFWTTLPGCCPRGQTRKARAAMLTTAHPVRAAARHG